MRWRVKLDVQARILCPKNIYKIYFEDARGATQSWPREEHASNRTRERRSPEGAPSYAAGPDDRSHPHEWPRFCTARIAASELIAQPGCHALLRLYIQRRARAMTLGLMRTRCGFDRCFRPYGLLPLSCPQLSVSSSLFLLNTHLAWIRLLRSIFVPFSPWKSTLRRTYAHLQRSRKGCRLTCPQPGGREMGGFGPSRVFYRRVQ